MFGSTGLSGGFGVQQQAPAFGAAPATGAFGQGFGGAFGQQQQQQPAFGAAAAPAFGAASTPAFGASPAPAFGASPAAPAFGAAPTSAFGTSAPAFGATGAFGAPRPAGAFGGFGTTSTFGASQPAFGAGLGGSTFGAAASQPAFGATSTPAFGASSTPGAFGAAPSAFGSTSQAPSPFGGTTGFGAQPAQSQSAFGLPQSTGLFGAPAATPTTPAFGAAPASTGLFGATGFGAAGTAGSPGTTGTRVAPYQKTVERDGTNATGTAATANFISITAMPQYQSKSFEELRFEDYQAGIKSAAAAPAPQTSTFGSPTPAPAFGLGATTSAFGTPSSTPAFGTPSTSTFGGGTGLFGTQAPAAAPAFGSSTPAFGANPFAPAAASTPAFGAPSAAPAFGTNPFNTGAAAQPGAFGAASAPRPAGSSLFSFNTSPAGAFGAASTGATGFGSTAPSIFGAASTPATGGGLFGSPAPNPFAPAATPGTTNAFGSAFGQKPATPGAFGAQAPAFGASTGSAFGTGMFGQTGGGLFQSSFPAASSAAPSMFGSTPSLFGNTTSPSLFGGQQQQQFGAAGGGMALQPFQTGAAAAAQPAAPLSVAVAPYGAFPSLPTVPEPKVGISSRPARTTSAGYGGAGRASPLVSLRATASGAPHKLGAVTGTMSRGVSLSPLGSLGVVVGDSGAGAMSLGTTPVGTATGTPGLLRPRANPHQLFIREPPPSTHGAPNGSAFSPARTPAPDTPAHQNGTTSTANGTSAAPYNPFPLASPAARDTATPAGGAADGGGPSGRNGSAATRNGGAVTVDGGRGNGTPKASRPSRHLEEEEEEDHSYLPQLGRLTNEDYSYEPSSRQLVAMHQGDPESLSRVSNFTVERRGVGSVRWLNPVDVRGLKLEDIISIQPGEVAVFTNVDDKPSEGEGLNSEALITLWDVYKTDRDGNPVKEGPAVMQWERKLRNMCAKMGSKFVSYKAAGGVWKFEVEHFSRYGLLQDDDDDEEEEQQPPTHTGTDNGPVEVVMVVEEEREVHTEWTSGGAVGPMQHGSSRLGRSAMHMHKPGGKAPAARPSAPSAPLQHTLATHLALAPDHMMTLHDTFFANDQPQPAAPHPSAAPSTAGVTTAVALPHAAPAAAPTAAPVSPGGAPMHMWRTPAPALTSSRRPLTPTETSAETAMALSSPSVHVLSPPRGGTASEDVGASHHHMDAGLSLGLSFRVGWGPNGTLIIPGPPGLRMGSGAQPVMVRRVLVEGHGSGYGSDAGLDSMDTAEGHAVPPRLAALRTKLRALLQVHLRHSAPTADSSSAGPSGSTDSNEAALPQWQLRCGADSLPALVSQLVAAAQSPAAELGAAGAAVAVEEEEGLAQVAGDEDWQAEVQHEVETWKLLKVLFEAEPPGTTRPASSITGGNGVATEAEAGAVEAAALDAAMDPAACGPPPLAAALHRQSGFSRWLQQQVLPDVRSSLQRSGGGSSSCGAVLELLSAHQLAGAAAVAAAAGDVRLATLAACAGLRAAAQTQARQQLEVWDSTGMTARIAPDRLLVYRLLAGQVSEVIRYLSLDWRRALGLYVWYHAPSSNLPGGSVNMPYGTLVTIDNTSNGGAPRNLSLPFRNQPGALAVAAATYHQQLLAHEALPLPLPPHCRGLLPSSIPQDQPTDLQYSLLQLWVEQEQAAAAAAEADDGIQPVLTLRTPPQLLAAASHSSNPCAAALPWALLTVLQSVGVVGHVGDQQLTVGAVGGDADVAEQWELTLAGHMALVSQLLLAGELCELAVYVALHLPDRPSGAQGKAGGRLRHAVVRHLLALTAPEWVGHVWREAFFSKVLNIPQVLLSEAAAGWALARGDTAGAVQQHLAAQQWQSAHAMLVAQLAPQLVCQDRISELVELLSALAPHSSACTDWQFGGGLYLQYLEAVHASQTHVTSQTRTAASPIDLQRLVTDLAEAKARSAAALCGERLLAMAEPGEVLGKGDSGVLVRLAAFELMSRRVQALVMRKMAAVAKTGGGFDLPCLLGAFSRQASTRSVAIGAAAHRLVAQVLAA